MNKLFLRNLIFVVIFLAILISMQALLIQGLRFRTTDEFGIWNKSVNGQINADILLAGSSRTLVGMDCEPIESAMKGMSCYNIGMDGTRLKMQKAFLETYLKNNKKPKVIIQGLDIVSLGVYDGVYNPKQYIAYLSEENVYRPLVETDQEFMRYKYLPLYSFSRFGVKFIAIALKGYLEHFHIISRTDERVKGQWPKDLEWTNEFEKYKKVNPDGVKQAIEVKAIEHLEGIIELVKAYNVPIVLVYLPEYFENISFTINRPELFRQFQAVADKYNVSFWDFSASDIGKNKGYFYNSQHLNREGAKEFSEWLAQKLEKYLR